MTCMLLYARGNNFPMCMCFTSVADLLLNGRVRLRRAASQPQHLIAYCISRLRQIENKSFNSKLAREQKNTEQLNDCCHTDGLLSFVIPNGIRLESELLAKPNQEVEIHVSVT